MRKLLIMIIFSLIISVSSEAYATYETPAIIKVRPREFDTEAPSAKVQALTSGRSHEKPLFTPSKEIALQSRIEKLTPTPKTKKSLEFRAARVIDKREQSVDELSLDAERYARWFAIWQEKYSASSLERTNPILISDWYKKTSRLRRNVSDSKIYEHEVVLSFNVKDNNGVGAITFPVPEDGTRTRPDGIGVDRESRVVILEHKNLLPGSELFNTKQLRAQRDGAKSLGGRHIIVITSPVEVDIANNKPINPPVISKPLKDSDSEIRLVSTKTGNVFRYHMENWIIVEAEAAPITMALE